MITLTGHLPIICRLTMHSTKYVYWIITQANLNAEQTNLQQYRTDTYIVAAQTFYFHMHHECESMHFPF